MHARFVIHVKFITNFLAWPRSLVQVAFRPLPLRDVLLPINHWPRSHQHLMCWGEVEV